MRNLSLVIFLMKTVLVCGQNISGPYLFQDELYQSFEKDTVPWKYQKAATEFSFIGQYADVLRRWDENGFNKPKIGEMDSLYFAASKKVKAKDYILEQSKKVNIIIINEAHHVARHRLFTKSLLSELYAQGYRYLGLEALADSLINQRKYPVLESGYYTQEPEFGNLVAEALKLGFTIFGYEASEGKNGKDREIEQAENIQRFMDSHPEGKLLIHCGYAHAYENDYPVWGKAMAGRLKENTKSDPLTINQTMFLERSKEENNHPFINWTNTNHPIILLDENDQPYNGSSEVKQTDLVIIYPRTVWINNRPTWQSEGKQKYVIPQSKIKPGEKLMIMAYRNHEYANRGVPADLLETSNAQNSYALYLSPGDYEIIIKDTNYQVVENYTIQIR